MRILLLIFICFFQGFSVAHACNHLSKEKVALSFQDVPVLQFAQATYKGMLGCDYVIMPSVSASDKRLTINLQRVEKGRLPQLLDQVLFSVGIRSEYRDGVYYLDVSPLPVASSASGQPVQGALPPQTALMPSPSAIPDVLEPYRPRYRDSEYLRTVLASVGLLPRGATDKAATAPDLLLLTGTRKQVDRARALLDQIDTPQGSVHVRAILVEYTDTEDHGRSFTAALNALSGKLRTSFGPTDPLGNFVSFKNTTIAAVLSAIDSDSRFKYVSEPSLQIMDGQRGRLVVGSEVPVRGASTVTESGQVIQSVEYRSSGVLLTVQPRIYAAGIALHLFQQVSNFSTTKTSGIDSPTLVKRELETQVQVQDGELLVLAGMDEDKQTNARSGLFFLPKAMDSNSRSTSRTQLLIFMEVKKAV